MNDLPATGPQGTLLFIPDISGYTRFLRDTEIEHSRHIIGELLECLIDQNELGLIMSELEGDAILFHRPGAPPTTAQLLAQVRRMFVAFHAHLKRYETQRICRCGACSGAGTLTVKFFAHYGEVAMNRVKEQSKLFGQEVILVHRLMKNSLASHEYALITDNLMQAMPDWSAAMAGAWAAPADGTEQYDLGPVNFKHFALAPLQQQVPEPAAEDFSVPGATDMILFSSGVIEAPMELVFDVLTDLSIRHQWIPGLQGVDRLNHKIAQAGSTHRCILNRNDSDPLLVSHGHTISHDRITFVESDHRQGTATVYTLIRQGTERTAVEVNCFMKPNAFKRTLFNLLMKKKLVKWFEASFLILNDHCRKLVAEGRGHANHIELGLVAEEVGAS